MLNYDFYICHLIVRHVFDLNFQSQTFQVGILTNKHWENAAITIAIR